MLSCSGDAVARISLSIIAFEGSVDAIADEGLLLDTRSEALSANSKKRVSWNVHPQPSFFLHIWQVSVSPMNLQKHIAQMVASHPNGMGGV